MDTSAKIDRISTLIADKVDDDSGEPTVSLDLAALQPLSHTNPFLSAETFSVENFLLSRSHASLSDFRAELRDYHGVLKEELVKLINDDYAAFISLSTDLKGEGVRIEKLKYPLGSLKQDVQLSVNQLRQIQEAIQAKLDERAALREEKARLHLLLKLSETLTRLESLLFIIKEDSPEASFSGISARVTSNSDQGLETRTRTNRVKHISRTAAEFNQLLYLMDKAQQDNCAFSSEIQWRVDRVKDTLSSDLNHLFSLLLLTRESIETADPRDSDAVRWKSDINECLRIYSSIGNWREAEEIIRRDLMTPFIRQTIFPGALAVPHSPLAPRTPFMAYGMSVESFPPKTPYSAFPLTPWPRKTPFEAQFPSYDFQLPLLSDQDNPLAEIYNKVLRFIEKDLKAIMELAEMISERHRQSAVLSEDGTTSNDPPGFEIMSNVVWADIGRAIMEALGKTIFAAGRPDDFHENYMTTQNFIAALEVLAPSLHAVKQMRNHQDIVNNLESSFSLPIKRKNTAQEGPGGFLLSQTESCFIAICSCWAEDIYIPEIGHRFWRLTLQILSRYCVWLETFEAQAPKNETEKLLSNTQSSLLTFEAPSPVALSEVSNESLVIEDTVLSQCGLLVSDIKMLERKVLEFWDTHISVILPETEEGSTSPSVVFRNSSNRLLAVVPTLGSHIIAVLVRRCCENLVAVRSVPSQYRALPNKRMPVTPSPFILEVLKPVKLFFQGVPDFVKDNLGPQWITEIFDVVCTRFVSHLAFTKKTEESLRRLKKGKRSAFPLFGSSASNSGDIDGKEEERVRAQMMLDVAALGNSAKELGVDISQNSCFRELEAMASSVGKSSILSNLPIPIPILQDAPQ